MTIGHGCVGLNCDLPYIDLSKANKFEIIDTNNFFDWTSDSGYSLMFDIKIKDCGDGTTETLICTQGGDNDKKI